MSQNNLYVGICLLLLFILVMSLVQSNNEMTAEHFRWRRWGGRRHWAGGVPWWRRYYRNPGRYPWWRTYWPFGYPNYYFY